MKQLKSEIVGSLDYDLRHGHFSGVSGSFDNMKITYYADNGTICKIQLKGKILSVDSSEVKEPWTGSPQETEEFIRLAKLYIDGVSGIYRADSPGDLSLGMVEDKNGKAHVASIKLSEFNKLGDRLDTQKFLSKR